MSIITIIVPHVRQDSRGVLDLDFTLGRANLWLTNEHPLYRDDSSTGEIAVPGKAIFEMERRILLDDIALDYSYPLI
jgi:hypothetical protein